jgi:AcrR family transcriptional regulator
LLDAAATLLDEGGLDAVTLREVGARAGVSRGAPYGHFADKEELLAALAIESWVAVAERLRALRRDDALDVRGRLRGALREILELARDRPSLYALMFVAPSREPGRLIDAAAGAQDEFLAIVGDAVGNEGARPRGALLMSSAHGIASMESSGQLDRSKWEATSDELLELLIDMVAR